MRVLTIALAALGAVGSCRAHETPESPEDALEAPTEVGPSPPATPTVVYGESITTEERSSTASSTSIEVDYRGWLDDAGPRSRAPGTAESTSKCCRTCRAGKACGNTCIAADRVCRAAPGCACDG